MSTRREKAGAAVLMSPLVMVFVAAGLSAGWGIAVASFALAGALFALVMFGCWLLAGGS